MRNVDGDALLATGAERALILLVLNFSLYFPPFMLVSLSRLGLAWFPPTRLSRALNSLTKLNTAAGSAVFFPIASSLAAPLSLRERARLSRSR